SARREHLVGPAHPAGLVRARPLDRVLHAVAVPDQHLPAADRAAPAARTAAGRVDVGRPAVGQRDPGWMRERLLAAEPSGLNPPGTPTAASRARAVPELEAPVAGLGHVHEGAERPGVAVALVHG